ncbi:MAG: type VI secretion system tip protein TssI/VgrG [Bacteroidota bacterium]
MFELPSNTARFYFKPTNLGPDELRVVSYTGVEELSQPYRFDLKLASENPEIDFNAVVNQPATLIIMRSETEEMYLNGIVSHLEQAGRTAEVVTYRAVLVPRLWRLTLRHHSRIYMDNSIIEIITDILTKAGLSNGTDFKFKTQGTYEPREYCAQYRETDLAFVSRLMEHDGLYYFFEHDGEKEVLVITDDQGEHDTIEGEELKYREAAGLARDSDSIQEIICQEQVITQEYLTKEYNHRTPETALQATKAYGGDGVAAGTHYEYGDAFRENAAGTKIATVRLEEIACQQRILRGQSDCVAMRSGHVFSLKEFYRTSLNEDYLITQVQHQGTQRLAMGLMGAVSESEVDLEYVNTFVCIPARVQYRAPRTTPVPRIPGVMSAKIESASNDSPYPYIDDDGKYRARMHFDLEDDGMGQNTMPIRMNQWHSGPNYGVHFPLHPNTEIMWACIDGNVDRPVALGTVPNPSNASPVVAENKMQNVIRTKPGNQMIMDDTVDECSIRVNTPQNNLVLIEDGKGAVDQGRITLITTKMHNVKLDDEEKLISIFTTNGHFMVFQDGSAAPGDDGEFKDLEPTGDDKGGKITIQSQAKHKFVIDDKEGKLTLIDASGKNHIQIDVKEDPPKLSMFTETGNIDIHAPEGHIDIKGKTIKTESTENTDMVVGGDMSIEVAGNQTDDVTGDISISAGGNLEETAGMDLSQDAGMNLSSSAGMAHSIEGLNCTSKANAKNEMSGMAGTTVSSAAVTEVMGSLVKIN